MVLFNKKTIIIMLVCFETSFTSCQTKIVKIEMVKKNPTEYVFNTPMDNLYSQVSKLRVSKMTLWDASKKNMVKTNISTLFLQSNNKFDFYLEPVYYLRKSKIYQKETGDSLDYLAGFYLHLESINESHAKISITTIDPLIVIGRDLLPSPPNMVRKDKTMPVEPSTIEEYEILLEIGRLVGEKNMPPINLPEKNNNAPK
jgi:hypothetical protein